MPIDPPAPLPPWTVERSHPLVRDRWISLRADACRTAEGAPVEPYYVLDYPDWIQIVAIDGDDRVILVEQYRHGLGISSLELPTGAMEPNDADPIAAGRRELEEETGFRSSCWQLVATLAPNPANQNNRCHVVLARECVADGAREDNPAERVRVSRVSIDQAAELARNGGIVQAMHVAALALTLTGMGRWLPARGPAPA